MKSFKSNVVPLKSDSSTGSKFDLLKWFIVFTLILAGLLGNHYYSDISMPIRTLGWLSVLAIAAFVAATTAKGGQVVEFFRDSKMELRKVIWPTREETVQTTLVVGAMVIVLALVLWGMDSVLFRLIGWLTGQRG